MPFGLTNALAVSQALINDVRQVKLICVCLPQRHPHLFPVSSPASPPCPTGPQVSHGEPVFMKADKCEFHRSTISFLRYIIAAGNIQLDPDKVRAVVDWPQPISRVQLQCFLGFAYFYHRFVWGYSIFASPLSAFTSPKFPFICSPEADRAFSDLKQRFTTAPILIHLDPSHQFVVEFPAFCPGQEAAFLRLPFSSP